MDASWARIAITAIAFTVLPAMSLVAQAATYRTANFIITAPTDEFARIVGEAAEEFRHDLSLAWTGRAMPRWGKPCPISCKVGNYPAGGATTFNFDRGEVYGWNMEVQGTPERILDSVLPHEVNHTIFACHFRRPLPRWADEGAASLIEHESERMRLEKLAIEATGGNRKIPLRTLLGMKNYPQDQRQVLTLYAQGYLLADYLIAKSSKAEYLKFLQTAHEQNWDTALSQHYAYRSVEQIEQEHDRWVLAGCPRDTTRPGEMLAANTSANPPVAARPASNRSMETRPSESRPAESRPLDNVVAANESAAPPASPRGFSLTRPFERRPANPVNPADLRVRGQSPETSQSLALLEEMSNPAVASAANSRSNNATAFSEGYAPADLPPRDNRSAEAPLGGQPAPDARLLEARAALQLAAQEVASGGATPRSAASPNPGTVPGSATGSGSRDRADLSRPVLQQSDIPHFQPRATARPGTEF